MAVNAKRLLRFSWRWLAGVQGRAIVLGTNILPYSQPEISGPLPPRRGWFLRFDYHTARTLDTMTIYRISNALNGRALQSTVRRGRSWIDATWSFFGRHCPKYYTLWLFAPSFRWFGLTNGLPFPVLNMLGADFSSQLHWSWSLEIFIQTLL